MSTELDAMSCCSRSSYMASTRVLNRAYMRSRLTLRVGVTGSALSLGIERLGQDTEILDLLGPRQLAVRSRDFGSDQCHHVAASREAGKAGIGHVVVARPVRHRIGVDLDERGQVFATVAEHHDFTDEGAGAKHVLDE